MQDRRQFHKKEEKNYGNFETVHLHDMKQFIGAYTAAA
jgi:hypothetical protein